MHPVGTRKRKSDEMAMDSDDQYTVDMTSQKIPTKGESPQTHETPVKRQRVGITAAQKEALIENLQLEITERARKLRANYNIHAQTLRTRIEIRVNRLPLSLRKVTMGELLEKYSTEEQPKPSATAGTIRGNSVPAKETSSSRPPVRAHISSRPVKRTSHEISGGDKENEVETPQKKLRANTITSIARQPTHALSPTTANSRIAPRTIATPGGGRSGIARPAITPGRVTAASTLLNKMVERSTTRPTTATGTRPPTATGSRKPTALSSSTNGTSSTTAAAASAKNRKRGATVSAAHHPSSSQPTTNPAASTTSHPATRTARRASNSSEINSSNNEANRKRPMTAPPGARPPVVSQAAAKRSTVMSSINGAGAGSVGGTVGKKAGVNSGVSSAAGTVRRGTVGKAAGGVLPLLLGRLRVRRGVGF